MAPKDDIDNVLIRSDRLLVSPTTYRTVGPDAATPGAVEAVLQAADEINAFLQHNRRMVALGGLDTHRAQGSFDTCDVRYHHSFGKEYVEFEPRVGQPSGEAQDIPSSDVAYAAEPPTIQQPQVTTVMVVLYSTNKLAVFDMASVSAGRNGASAEPLYYQTLAGTDFGKWPIFVNQQSIGGLSAILSGADLTGQDDKGDHLFLCSTSIDDTVKTGATNDYLPIMNGGRGMVYTIGGSYAPPQPGARQWQLQTALSTAAPTNGQPPTPLPYAIDADGTCYYYGTFTGSASLTVFGPSSATDATVEPTMPDAVSQGLTAAIKDASELQTPQGATWMLDATGAYDNTVDKLDIINGGSYVDLGSGAAGWVGQTWSITNAGSNSYGGTLYVGAADLSDTPVNISTVVGESYYASAAFAGSPSLGPVKVAVTPGLYTTYVAEDNAQSQMLGTKETTDYSGDLPLPVYDARTASCAVALEAVQATTKVTHTLSKGVLLPSNERSFDLIAPTKGTDQFEYYPPQPPDTEYGFTNGGYRETGGNSDCEVWVAGGNVNDGLNLSPPDIDQLLATLPAKAQAVVEASLADAGYNYAGLKAAWQAYVTGQQRQFSFTTNQTLGPQVVTYMSSGALVGNTTSTTQGSLDQPVDTGGDYPIGKYYPGTIEVTDTKVATGSLRWNDQDIASGAASSQSITAYPFPMPLASPPVASTETETHFYTIVTTPRSGDPEQDTRTPYGKYTDVLTPWMHLSNAQYCFQGFSIGDLSATKDNNGKLTGPPDPDKYKNYLFVNGADFMTFLTSILSTPSKEVKTTDVVAAYIDIPLEIAQGLAKIVSSRYQETTNQGD